MTERELITGCIAKQRLAQHALYEQYKSAMYTLSWRITNDWGLAAEVLQDAFLQVFHHIGDFQGKSTLGAWIKTIVVRTAIRKVKYKAAAFEALDSQNDRETVDWGTDLDLEYLEQAIQALPEGFRAVFVLAEVEGFSHKEISAALGISEGTSKSQLFYAKKRLREQLGPMMHQ
jgi:RNA polymerase sigma-70 factor (ECF subfamily)